MCRDTKVAEKMVFRMNCCFGRNDDDFGQMCVTNLSEMCNVERAPRLIGADAIKYLFLY